jgi:hypothetical protein
MTRKEERETAITWRLAGRDGLFRHRSNPKGQRQGQQQIPFGDDNKKSKNKGKGPVYSRGKALGRCKLGASVQEEDLRTGFYRGMRVKF